MAVLLPIALIVALLAFEFLATSRAARFWLALERRHAGLRLREARIPGFTMPYLEGGRGEVLLLLHGFAGDKDNFTRVARFLTGHFRVIAPDLPGFGDATRDAAAPYHIGAQVERLHAFAAQLNLTSFHLGGNSMGGFIAAQYAAAHPAQLRSLWLLDAAGCAVAYDTDFISGYLQTGKLPMLVNSAAEFDALLAAVTLHPPWLPPSLRRTLARRAIADCELHRRIFREIGTESPTLEAVYPSITAPTLIVWGSEDRILSPSAAPRMQALIPSSETVLMAKTGHLPMVEHPRQAARDYLRFVSRHTA